MSLTSACWITVQNIKDRLDISETTWDTVLESIIEGTTKLIENHIEGTVINSGSDVTQYFDGGNAAVFVKNIPIVSVTSVSTSSGDYNSPTWTVLSATTDYIVSETTGEITLAYSPHGKRNIRVIYQGGYANAAAVPYDLKEACIQHVCRQFGRRKSHGVTSESFGGANISWNKGVFDDEVKAILDSYKRFL